MSSSTESMCKGEEKKGNLENYPKDEMPKQNTTVEGNSNGARPKTSSTSEMPIKEPVEKKFLKIMIMNASSGTVNESESSASGPNEDDTPTRRRKQTIQNVINRHNPDLVLFQEFSWKGISGNTWPTDTVSENYRLTGTKNSKIMYNNTELTEENKSENLQQILKEHESKNKEFNPMERMALGVFKTMHLPDMKFICISWHGKYKTKSQKTEFQNLMILLKKLYEDTGLPLLIGGDFNMKIEDIKKEDKYDFNLIEYDASERRKRVIDHFIVSKELHLSAPKSVNLKKDSQAKNPEQVLDHDPIKAKLKPAPASDTAPPRDEVTAPNEGMDDLIRSMDRNLASTTQDDLKKDLQPNKPEEVEDHDPLIAE